MKVIDDDDDELFPPRFPVAKNCCHGYPLQGTVTRARDYTIFRRKTALILVDLVESANGHS